METKTYRITNAAKLEFYNVLYIENEIIKRFSGQSVLYDGVESSFFKGRTVFDFGRKYGGTKVRIFNKAREPKWRAEFSGENEGIRKTKSALVEKIGLKFASLE